MSFEFLAIFGEVLERIPSASTSLAVAVEAIISKVAAAKTGRAWRMAAEEGTRRRGRGSSEMQEVHIQRLLKFWCKTTNFHKRRCPEVIILMSY